MRKYRDFKCNDCELIFEKRVLDEVRQISCECGGVAIRRVSAARYFKNTVGGSPSASSRK